MTDLSASAKRGPHQRVSAGRLGNSHPSSNTLPLLSEEGEWRAFEEMFVASRAKFVGLAYRILRNKEDAEDAVQDALLSAFVHLRRFEGRSAIKTWFTRVVLNAALMVRRKRKPRQVEFALETATAGDFFGMEQIPASKPDPEMCCAEGETLELVDALLGQLSPSLRQAFTMTYFEEMPVRQAGALAGVATRTFKSRLCRAKRHLKRLAKRSLVVPIRGPRPFPVFSREANFQDLVAKTGEAWSRDLAL